MALPSNKRMDQTAPGTLLSFGRGSVSLAPRFMRGRSAGEMRWRTRPVIEPMTLAAGGPGMDGVRAVILLALLVTGSGCADRRQVAALEKNVADLETQVEELKASVQELESQKSFDEILRNMEAVAYLTPGAEGYSTVQTDLGRMTVSLENVQAYANGTRVTLRFGNLTSATVNGAKAKVEWGSVDNKGVPKNDSAKSRQVSFSQSLRAGAWTNVQVVLEGVPPTELGFVRIREVTHTGVSLLR